MNIADEIQKLDGLRASGALSEEEYARAKTLVLGGAQAPAGIAPLSSSSHMDEVNPLKKFRRSSIDVWIGGVCGGLANLVPAIPSWLWRIGFCILILGYGTGLLLYVLLWIFVPLDTDPV